MLSLILQDREVVFVDEHKAEILEVVLQEGEVEDFLIKHNLGEIRTDLEVGSRSEVFKGSVGF